jgi:hypothetical protein
LKDYINYFREVAASYESKGKAIAKLNHTLNSFQPPPLFLAEGGILEANRILREFNKTQAFESEKAKQIHGDVITQLVGLRADLNQKTKEIKALSGDFKNSVDKEMKNTQRSVDGLQEALGYIDSSPAAVAGKGDPYIIKLSVDKQVKKQIDEENYLHRVCIFLREGYNRCGAD